MEHSATHNESKKIWSAIMNWFLVDKVFLVSFIIAIIAISFGGFTTRFFNYHVIVTVAGLMLVIGGFKETGLLQFLGQTLVKRSTTTRQLVRATTLLTFFLAIFFTNDLTILTILPLYLAITREIKNRKSVYIGAALIVPACHIGSGLLPQGNPHNLYLYSFYKVAANHNGAALTNLEFFKGTGALWLLGLLILMIACQFIDNEPLVIKTHVTKFNKLETSIFVVLMLLMAASVFGYINFYLAGAIVAVIVLFYRPHLFKGVDYHLLLTFVFFFLIVGNIANIHALTDFISQTLVGPQAAFLGTAILSQVISNIASPILISPFTPHAVPVILGADIGGIGTIVSSMATLIAYKVIRMNARGETRGFVKYFSIVNASFFAILIVIGLIIVTIIG
ncbi:cation transporter [Lactococcus taiwanensis]|uniref:Cation transporter n=1 Tax=Lactococcus taiwanensis TaxID=1151742 RepID=A0AA45QQZ8_9LACT|nr:SLC13 family permease [Lactococcus taiwanensis]KZK36443.1 putative membrane protein [Lactococcus cremoris]QRZ11118.1 cation transporter [Lactococcus taiwanensis]QSE76469.1 cation transporter [Lactococcus taiwanensis]